MPPDPLPSYRACDSLGGMEKAARNALVVIAFVVLLVVVVIAASTGTGRTAERLWLILAVAAGVGITVAVRFAWRAWRRRSTERTGSDADGS